MSAARSAAGLVVLALATVARVSAQAPNQNGIVQQWAGRIARPQAIEAPLGGVVGSTAEFLRLWQTLQVKGDPPAIDFEKFLVIVSTARSSVFKVSAVQVDDKGDLKTIVMATPDVTRDYAIVITQVERKGVKTVHGQPVP